MKYLTLAICILIFGCNSGGNAPKQPDASISKEQQLKNDIAKYPDSLLLTETLAQYYRESGKYDDAITVIKNSLKKDSTNARLWDIKATLEIENDDTDESLHSLEKAVSIFPEPKYLISLGILYAQTKNKNALQIAGSLLNAPNAHAEKEANFIKGLYFSYNNQKEKSIPYFDSCLAINYTYMDAYIEKALALYDLAKYEEALAVLDKAVTLQNNFEEGYYYRGKCLEKLNRHFQAIEAYQMALAYDPNYVEAKEALARLNSKTNNTP